MREIALGIYKTPNAVDHKEGIFQSIGYKEFADLELPQQDPASDPRFPAMVALTKLRTHQYARQQLKWIKKQLLPAVREARSLGGQVEVFAVPGGKDGEAPAIEALHGECIKPHLYRPQLFWKTILYPIGARLGMSTLKRY